MTKTKYCIECELKKDIELFSISYSIYYHSRCRKCMSLVVGAKDVKQRAQENPEKYTECGLCKKVFCKWTNYFKNKLKTKCPKCGESLK